MTLKPSKMEAGPTKLTLQPDGSIFAHGDAQKRDLYTLTLNNLPANVTAFRIEALPDERLPANGPGRAYYEGPKGDFLLGEFMLTVDGKRVAFSNASETHTRGNLTAKLALDGEPLTGWAGSGRPGVRIVRGVQPREAPDRQEREAGVAFRAALRGEPRPFPHLCDHRRRRESSRHPGGSRRAAHTREAHRHGYPRARLTGSRSHRSSRPHATKSTSSASNSRHTPQRS